MGNINELVRFLNKTPIPDIPKRPVTFLEIAKQARYENAWSSIYAFFFDQKAEHGLGNLFLRSFLELINEQNKDNVFYFSDEYEITLESSTNAKGRIDILLHNHEEAIIIENKVDHLLYNDLQDYWQSVKQEKKRGVILSLKKYSKKEINNEHFINITHFEFMTQVIENLKDYFLNVSDKYIIFLKDFYQNIINASNIMEQETIHFYVKNREEIKKINEIRVRFIEYVQKEIKNVRTKISDGEFKSSNLGPYLEYYLCPENENLMITVSYEKFLFEKNKPIDVMVEVKNELLHNQEFMQNCNKIEFEEKEESILSKDFFTKKGSWAHFAYMPINNIEETAVLNLGDKIADEINHSSILTIYDKLRAILPKEKN